MWVWFKIIESSKMDLPMAPLFWDSSAFAANEQEGETSKGIYLDGKSKTSGPLGNIGVWQWFSQKFWGGG